MQVVTRCTPPSARISATRSSAWLNERLISSCVAPPGIGHLEDPELAEDLTVAREFDRGQTGPPMSLNVDFVADGLAGLVVGVGRAVVLVGFAWWAPVVLLLAWGSTHWLLRESGVWKDRNTAEVRAAQRHAEYAYRLAVDPPPAKELRLFGLPDWALDRFAERRRELFELQYGPPGCGSARCCERADRGLAGEPGGLRRAGLGGHDGTLAWSSW